MTTRAVPVKPVGVNIERFVQTLSDADFAIYVDAKIKPLMEKLRKLKDCDWPLGIQHPTERGDARDVNDDIKQVPTLLDVAFVDDKGASACAFSGVVSDDEAADKPDRTVAPRVKKPQRAKRVSVPTTRYVDIDNGECDGEEPIDENYADVVATNAICAGFHAARYPRYHACLEAQTKIDANPNADNTKLQKWLDDKQKKFVDTYTVFDRFVDVIGKWIRNFESVKAKKQRKGTFKKVNTDIMGFGEGDEIHVSTPYGPLLAVPVTVFEEQDDCIVCYRPDCWGDAPQQVRTVLNFWDEDYQFWHEETGLSNQSWLIRLPKIDGWTYTQVQADACEPDIKDYDEKEEEDPESSSSGGISSCESGSDPDFESEDEEWDRKPRKKSNVPKKSAQPKVDGVTAEEAVAMQKFLEILRAERSGASAGSAGAAAGPAAGPAARPAAPPAARPAAAQSKSKPKPAGAAGGGAAQSKFKHVSAAVTAMRKKIQDNKRKGANTGASAGSAGAGGAAQSKTKPAGAAGGAVAGPVAKRPLILDSDEDEPLIMRKKPKVVSSSDSGSDSDSD